MIDRIVRTIDRHRMFPPGRVGAAVSGGADSVCLLHVLMELAQRYGIELSVLHVNHNLRGAESDADARFVCDLAAGMGLRFHLRDIDLSRVRDNLEQAARRARLAFFQELLADGAVDRVALGHTRSDQAETVLFRFLRGSGSAGLSGIRPVTGSGLVRPLIEIERSEVLAYLTARGIAWREDSTNASPDFARNRIRHTLLPQLVREWNPAMATTLAQTADWAQAEEEWWQSEIGRLADEHLTWQDGSAELRADALRKLPLAAARRLVRHAIGGVKGDLRGVNFGHIEAVLALVSREEGGVARIPGVSICRSLDWVRFAKPSERISWRITPALPGSTPLPGARFQLSLEMVDKSETSPPSSCVYNSEMGCIDWGLLAGSPTLRNWRPGDRYQPMGTHGEEKLKNLFQQARIPVWERFNWPVLEVGERIVWSRRFGPAAWCAAGSHTEVILKVREVTC